MILGLVEAVVQATTIVLAAGVIGVWLLVWSAPAFWRYGAVRGLAQHFGRKP